MSKLPFNHDNYPPCRSPTPHSWLLVHALMPVPSVRLGQWAQSVLWLGKPSQRSSSVCGCGAVGFDLAGLVRRRICEREGLGDIGDMPLAARS